MPSEPDTAADALPASEDATLPPAATEPYSVPAPAVLPDIFGRYRLLKHLGAGGMGAVYLAEDTLLHRQVALKTPFLHGPDADALRGRFLQEARAAAALRHPNICPIHDLGEIDGVPYLTMPFITGAPLSRRLRAEPPLPLADAVNLAHKLAVALQASHDHGVIHRDLKPANILMDECGEPIIMDFGLARCGGAPLDQHLTQEGQMLGTPAYMPPEQLEGNVRAMGPACDVYSLGVVLYELLTGKPPFEGDLIALASQIALEPAPPPSRRRPEISPDLDAVCLRALAKQPAERWPSMREFAAALRHTQAPAIATVPAFPRGGSLRAPGGPSLTLRVVGTAFAYRPQPDQDTISVGRQRRAAGDPPDHGNDFVLRIAGSDELTTRISRRHFEIVRRGPDYCVVDRSKLGLQLNGQWLPKNEPTLLRSADRLTVAGVVTLEIVLHQGPVGGLVSAMAEVPAASPGRERVVLEASMGDMITTE